MKRRTPGTVLVLPLGEPIERRALAHGIAVSECQEDAQINRRHQNEAVAHVSRRAHVVELIRLVEESARIESRVHVVEDVGQRLLRFHAAARDERFERHGCIRRENAAADSGRGSAKPRRSHGLGVRKQKELADVARQHVALRVVAQLAQDRRNDAADPSVSAAWRRTAATSERVRNSTAFAIVVALKDAFSRERSSENPQKNPTPGAERNPTPAGWNSRNPREIYSGSRRSPSAPPGAHLVRGPAPATHAAGDRPGGPGPGEDAVAFWSTMVYLDFNATTPVRAPAREAMLRCLPTDFGNPSSLHRFGRAAAQAREEARRRVARAAGCAPEEVVFTSGGVGSVEPGDSRRGRGARDARPPSDHGGHRARGGPAHGARPGNSGLRDSPFSRSMAKAGSIRRRSRARFGPERLSSRSWRRTTRPAFFSIFAAIGALCRRHGALFHTDAVQLFRKASVSIR